MAVKTVKQFAQECIIQARRRAGYNQKEVANRLGMTLEEYRMVEKLEKSLLPHQIEYLKYEMGFRGGYMQVYSEYWNVM